jgi:hypothetical protein
MGEAAAHRRPHPALGELELIALANSPGREQRLRQQNAERIAYTPYTYPHGFTL